MLPRKSKSENISRLLVYCVKNCPNMCLIDATLLCSAQFVIFQTFNCLNMKIFHILSQWKFHVMTCGSFTWIFSTSFIKMELKLFFYQNVDNFPSEFLSNESLWFVKCPTLWCIFYMHCILATLCIFLHRHFVNVFAEYKIKSKWST